ncbi:MAG: C13 family peptidase [Vicinamibacterales bacterium]
MLKAFLLVIVGLAGEPEHGDAFNKWGSALAEQAPKLGVESANVIYLGEAESPVKPAARATRVEIEKAIGTFAAAASPEDVVYIVLIGHGSFDGRDAKINLPGPDLSAGDFNTLLRKLPTKQTVLVNTASASGPFVETLSGPGRTIITATRSGSQNYATIFGGYFVDALTTEAADADKNRRISMLEAFLYARGQVAAAYEREGLLATEHALLDDNGDKEGSQEPAATAADGKLAASLSLGSTADAELPADPKLRALYVERRDMERRVESLRLLKDSMDPAKYTAELEKLVTALALKTREIRAAEGQR